MKKEFFSTFEMAEICNVSPGSISRWINEGKINTSYTPGGHHRIKREAVVGLLKTMQMPVPQQLRAGLGSVVLVVDDDPAIRSLVTSILKKSFPGIEVDTAEDGFTAGAKLGVLQPDVVILDIKLPGLDGYKVCQFIKEHSDLRHTKIVAITGLDEKESREKILQLGADDYLHKPFKVDELVEKLCRLSGKLGAQVVER